MCYHAESSLPPPWEIPEYPVSSLSPVPVLEQWMLCPHSQLLMSAQYLQGTQHKQATLSPTAPNICRTYYFHFHGWEFIPGSVACQGQQCAGALDGREQRKEDSGGLMLTGTSPIQTCTRASCKTQKGLIHVLGQQKFSECSVWVWFHVPNT